MFYKISFRKIMHRKLTQEESIVFHRLSMSFTCPSRLGKSSDFYWSRLFAVKNCNTDEKARD